MEICFICGLNRLFEAYNDYSSREFGGDPIRPQDVPDGTLGVCYTTCTMDEDYKDERDIQIDYDFINNIYKCYITDENGTERLVYTETAGIEQAIDDFSSCEFDEILHHFSWKIQRIKGYEQLCC